MTSVYEILRRKFFIGIDVEGKVPLAPLQVLFLLLVYHKCLQNKEGRSIILVTVKPVG